MDTFFLLAQVVFMNALFQFIEFSRADFDTLIFTTAKFLKIIISAEINYPYDGILWFSDLLQPDPYYILPVSVGALGIFNYFVSFH